MTSQATTKIAREADVVEAFSLVECINTMAISNIVSDDVLVLLQNSIGNAF
jgi:hypothetical protein